ncbi:Tetratricopeptide repeat protein 12 [Trichoplax sp. H2]|nr:Tetratricopeptide repeat protein 12 [Trichoplax sp. H2]|eukprot:RDD39667.1 Tetratricopeptide repeat protein 12 [Trichoplax sp. H2]
MHTESLVKDLASSDTGVAKEAMSKADELIGNQKLKYDKSSINKSTTSSQYNDNPQQSIDQEAFCRSLQLDAEERSERRKKREEIANRHKDQGNKYFREGQFDLAIAEYTKAIETAKHITVYYTNRAQAYVKLKDWDSCIADCDMALRIDEKFLKAYVHYSKALIQQAKYDEADKILNTAVEKTKRNKIIQDYKTLNEIARQGKTEENEAITASTNESQEYELIKTLIGKCNDSTTEENDIVVALDTLGLQLGGAGLKQAYYRVCGGWEIIHKNSFIARLWKESTVNKTQVNLITAMIRMMTAAIENNDRNLQILLEDCKFLEMATKWINCDIEEVVTHVMIIIALLVKGSNRCQWILFNKLQEQPRFLQCLTNISCMNRRLARVTLDIIKSLQEQERFRIICRESINKYMVDPLCSALGDAKKLKNLKTEDIAYYSSLSEILLLIAIDDWFRERLAKQTVLWLGIGHLLNIAAKAPKNVENLLHAMLGLMLNLCAQASENAAIQNFSNDFLPSLVNILTTKNEDIFERLTRCIARLIGFCTKKSWSLDLLPKICPAILVNRGRPVTLKALSTCLAYCTKNDQKAAIEFLLDFKDLVTIFTMMINSDDDSIVGNSSLACSHIIGQAKISQLFIGSDIVADLLRIVDSSRKNVTRKNAGIALAKLSQSDARHLERLRDLHGVEILHSVLDSFGKI